MLLAGMNYDNSLALMLCFMLCGVTLVSMHECHGMLSGLKLLRAEVDNTFAGQLGELQLLLRKPADARAHRADAALAGLHSNAACSCQPEPRTRCELAYQAGARGRQRIERLELSSNAPLGLFRAWTWLHLPLEAIVYPAPSGARPLPPPRRP